MGDEKENVLRELRKSGFPTEIKVTEHLKNKSARAREDKCRWHHKNQQSYFDESENKTRQIDLLAAVYMGSLFLSDKEENKIIKLYIECKKSDTAKWVFYTSSPSKFDFESMEFNRWTTDRIYSPFVEVPVSYKTINPYIGLVHQIVFRKNDDFYSAQMQALKAIYYCENAPPMKEIKTLFIPVVVFEGGMYRYDVTKKEPKIHKIRYLRYLSHGIPESSIPLHVDVVHIDFFSEYINLIEKEIIAL